MDHDMTTMNRNERLRRILAVLLPFYRIFPAMDVLGNNQTI
jgi:hypothetical protein